MESSTAWRALPGNAAKVLAVMWDLGFVRGDDAVHMVSAYAKTATIAERSGLGLRATGRWISFLRSEGWISTSARRIGMTVVGLNFVVFTSPTTASETGNRVYGAASPERTKVRSGERTKVRSGERTKVRSRTPSGTPSTTSTTTTVAVATDGMVGGGGDVVTASPTTETAPTGPLAVAGGTGGDQPDRQAIVTAMVSHGIQRSVAETLAADPAIVAAGPNGVKATAAAVSREAGVRNPAAVLAHRLRTGAIERPRPARRPHAVHHGVLDYGVERIDPATAAPPEFARTAVAEIRAMLKTGQSPMLAAS